MHHIFLCISVTVRLLGTLCQVIGLVSLVCLVCHVKCRFIEVPGSEVRWAVFIYHCLVTSTQLFSSAAPQTKPQLSKPHKTNMADNEATHSSLPDATEKPESVIHPPKKLNPTERDQELAKLNARTDAKFRDIKQRYCAAKDNSLARQQE
jgi:hypothetical protein